MVRWFPIRGSTNGTLINGAPLRVPVVLANVCCAKGITRIIFHIDRGVQHGRLNLTAILRYAFLALIWFFVFLWFLAARRDLGFWVRTVRHRLMRFRRLPILRSPPTAPQPGHAAGAQLAR